MDWLRQIPLGQYVDGAESWLRRLDPRLKLAWSLVFLLTPVLAGPLWRLALVFGLLLITLFSGLPLRLWWRSLLLLTLLSIAVGLLSLLLPPPKYKVSKQICWQTLQAGAVGHLSLISSTNMPCDNC